MLETNAYEEIRELLDYAADRIIEGGDMPEVIEWKGNTHGIEYGEDETGEYIIVGFVMPSGCENWYIEGSFGEHDELNGFRRYL